MSVPRRPGIFMMDLWAIVPYYTAYLSKALLAEGTDVTVGSITYYLDPACFTSRGIKVDPGVMNVVGRFKLAKLPRRVFKLAEAMLNMLGLIVRFTMAPPDVVHVQYLPMLRWSLPLDFWFLEFCRWRGSKIVLTVHDLLPHDSANKYRNIFDKLYRFVDLIICHSTHIQKIMQEEFSVNQAKITVIPHGPFFYDLQPTATKDYLSDFNLPSNQLFVLWQGIIFPYKGIDLLLDSWQRVEAVGVNASLVIAGTGAPELLEQIRAQVERLGLRQVHLHFRFLSTEELVALYRAADIVVYPYRAITTSGALATGLALGKTIVASDLPVFRELLVDKQNARLVTPHDAQELGEALVDLLQDPAERERLALKVREMNFGDETWREIARETVRNYHNLIS